MKRSMQNQQLSPFSGPSTSTGTRDMLYTVMEQCKSAEKVDAFVQDVTCAPEPMAVLCSAQQLNDVVRFCCDAFNFSVMGIDPTFNLGEFSVTPTVYRHLLIQDPRSGKSPLLLGPILVHYRKQFRSYNYFFLTLVGLKQELTAVKAIGTDGEKSLADAAIRNFPQAAHVRCFRHLQQNIERHLHDQQFPPTISKTLVRDIFGWNDSDGTYREGLVDSCDTNAFDNDLAAIEKKWNDLESQAFSNRKSHDPEFHLWFVNNKAEEFRQCTLRPLREDIGLGCPPAAFYTNDSESINAKKHQWGLFNNKVKQLVKQQQQEVEKVLIGYGVCELRQQYSFLSVAEDKWFRMSEEQRLRHLHKFNTCSVRAVEGSASRSVRVSSPEASSVTHSAATHQLSANSSLLPGPSSMLPDITTGRFNANSNKSLSIDVEDAAKNIKLPYTTVEAMWKKAEMLVAEENAVVIAPGFGKGCKMVKSKSGSVPHLVTVNEKNWQYTCGEKCLQFKSASVCSHTVAAAEINGDLIKFIQFLSRHKCAPNLMELASHGMPAGAGRKGGKVAKKKVQRKAAPSEENRISLGTQSSSNTPAFPPSYSTYPHYSSYSPYPAYPPYQQSPSSWPLPQSPYWSPNAPISPESFKVHHKSGNISVCSGCRSPFSKQEVIVLQHSEHRQYTSPRSGLASSKYGNAYYHMKRWCVEQKWGSNIEIVIPDIELNTSQRQTLYDEFGVGLP